MSCGETCISAKWALHITLIMQFTGVGRTPEAAYRMKDKWPGWCSNKSLFHVLQQDSKYTELLSLHWSDWMEECPNDHHTGSFIWVLLICRPKHEIINFIQYLFAVNIFSSIANCWSWGSPDALMQDRRLNMASLDTTETLGQQTPG